ncbi:MAG: hypothetical protein LQ345_000488 [Seirophora villosa]|nr:MAG: hypothetical protein LQ345_000488 [Seirophora villosa]
MAGPQPSATPHRRRDLTAYGCRASSKGFPSQQSFKKTTLHPAPVAYILLATPQTVQISADGLRNGHLGDDAPDHRAKEGVPIDILPRETPFPVFSPPSLPFSPPSFANIKPPQKQTKNTYHLADPSFTYLLSAFQLLTGLAWGIASTASVGATVRLTLIFIFVHCLLGSLAVATASYFLVGRLLGPGGSGGGGAFGGRRRRGLFGDATMAMADRDRERGEEGEGLEFGYCFDVAIRAFFPAWIFLYVVQFMLWPLISRDYWISLFLGNTLYLVACTYYTIIIFLGYNALPFLHHTELLLAPTLVYGVLWLASLFGFNVPAHVGPLFVLGAR